MNLKEKYVEKILALMAKAESTDFPEEAEALFGKAQELMTRYAIDSVQLHGVNASDIVTEMITCESPYGNDKALILHVIGLNNSCKVIRFSGRSGTYQCGVTGFASDVESVKMLFAGLMLHATRDMMRQVIPVGVHARRFRHAFLVGFAGRLGRRLAEVKQATVADVEAETGKGVGLVLVDKDKLVAEAFRKKNPRVVKSTTKVSSGTGLQAGEDSANRADLGSGRLAGSVGELNA